MRFVPVFLAFVLSVSNIWAIGTESLRGSLSEASESQAASSVVDVQDWKSALTFRDALRARDEFGMDLSDNSTVEFDLDAYAGTASYSKSESIRYAYLTGAAYCADPLFTLAGVPKLRKWNCKACKSAIPGLTNPTTNVRIFQSAIQGFFSGGALTNINGMVVYDASRNEIVVSFAGTNPTQIANIVVDLLYFQTNPSSLFPTCGSACLVHGGFFNAYNSVRSFVKTHVDALRATYSTAKLSFTGHSLGAALAALAAAHYVSMGYTVQPLYTFGMPRVGNAAFASWYVSRLPGTYRVVNNWDAVPHLGFRNTLGSKFQHFPYEIFYTGFLGFSSQFKAAPVLCNSSGEDGNCSNQYEALIYANIPGAIIDCHLLYMSQNYLLGFADCALA